MPRRRLRSLLITTLLFATTIAAPVHADWAVHSDVELGHSARKLRLGASMPLSGRLESGLVQHVWLRRDSYDTVAGTVRAPAAGYAFGYRRGDGRDGWGAALGLQYRKPRHPTTAARDNADEPALQLGLHLDGQLRLNEDWAAGGSLETYPSSKGVEVRGRLLHDIGNRLAIGPEVSLERHGDEEIRQVGLVMDGFEPLPQLKARVRAGLQQNQDGDDGAFFGFELQHRF